jgi:hypothetical protein
MHEENPFPLPLNNDDFLWEVVTFTKEIRLFLVKTKLSLFYHIAMQE